MLLSYRIKIYAAVGLVVPSIDPSIRRASLTVCIIHLVMHALDHARHSRGTNSNHCMLQVSDWLGNGSMGATQRSIVRVRRWYASGLICT